VSRLITFLLSVTAILVASPLLVLICCLLKLTGEGEVFYLQPRVGLNQRSFKIFKFATMLKNSPSMGSGLLTVDNDPRVLPVGRFLRESKINELPQLINMVKGDMNIVGPRPLVPEGDAQYDFDSRKIIRSVRPGLTGVGSLFLRDEEGLYGGREDPHDFYQKVIMPYKAALECWYVSNRSIALDAKIVIFTAVAIFAPRFDAEPYFAGIPTRPKRFDDD
jgi:lipopolysaccharide/colanic/teichoic acid biosynthesis glycosyltransferase